MDWKPCFYASSTSADVPINFRFNVYAENFQFWRSFFSHFGPKTVIFERQL